MRKLLDTTNSNTKIKKTQNSADNVRVASLSLMPDIIICPSCQIADCLHLCLKDSGLGKVYPSVANARQSKTDYWHNNKAQFIEQLTREISNFQKLCTKQNKRPFIRLNTLSDIQWEKHGIPQLFPKVNFLDYTKLAKRLDNTPDNYRLIFSYSRARAYQKQVDLALQTDAPIAVVFTELPIGNKWSGYTFLGRPIINGDKSDLINLNAGPVIVGLKYKRTNADADAIKRSDFVIDPNLIASAA